MRLRIVVVVRAEVRSCTAGASPLGSMHAGRRRPDTLPNRGSGCVDFAGDVGGG